MKHKATRHGAKPDVAPPEAATADGPEDRVAVDEPGTEPTEQYLRLAADFENFRKRTRRETAEQAAAEKNAFIRDMLPVLDNLERAMASDGGPSDSPLRVGVEMTLRQFGQLLLRHGIEAVEDVGRPFDAHRHNAIAVRNDPSQPDGSVLEVMQRGYCCGENIFRPAMVVVNDRSRSPGTTDAS